VLVVLTIGLPFEDHCSESLRCDSLNVSLIGRYNRNQLQFFD